ncbi:MAG: SPASM domain-containing protein, partial [bacterium]|nr:SPASM domain-containing protein [bacterium]
ACNTALFEQGSDFQGNMPRILYYLVENHENGAGLPAFFPQLARDLFPFIEQMILIGPSDLDAAAIQAALPDLPCDQLSISQAEEGFFATPSDASALQAWLNAVVVVAENGDVLPIDPRSAPRKVMGNLHRSRFADIWYGRMYAILRQSAKDGLPWQGFSCYNPTQVRSAIPHAREMMDTLDYMDRIHAFETSLAVEQRDKLRLAREKEATLDAKLIEAEEWEKRIQPSFLPMTYPDEGIEPISNIEPLSKVDSIRQLYGGRADQFGLLASVYPFDDVDRDWNQVLQGAGDAFYGNMPVRIELSVIYGCNIRCFMCDLSHQSDERQKEMLRQRLDLDTFKNLAADLFHYADNMIIGVAGEPSLHPDFPEFLRIASEAGLHMQLMSNGTTLGNDKIAQAIVNYIDEIVISMDGCTKDTFEKIRTGAKWDRVLEGIRNLNRLRETSPRSQLKISVNYALMRDNIDEFPQMFAFAKEMGIYKVMGEHLIVTSPEFEDKSLFHHKELADQRLKEAYQNAQSYGIEIVIPQLFNTDHRGDDSADAVPACLPPRTIQPDVPFCRLLTYSTVITPIGYVHPCCHPDAHRMLDMGHLHDLSFKQIWYGRAYQRLREGHDGVIPAPCDNCSMTYSTDGSAPVTQAKTNTIRLDEREDFSPYPMAFIPRRLRIMDLLYRQNRELDNHLQNLTNIEEQINAILRTEHRMERR